MQRFGRHDVEAFLRSVDAQLAEPCTVVLVGSTVAALQWDESNLSADIDVWSADAAFWDACRRVSTAAAPAIPVHRASIAEPPQDFETRLIPLSMGLSRLAVVVPEDHDWAIAKTTRALEHDLRAVEFLHSCRPLSLLTLVERYRETWVTGPRSRFRLKFLDLVARLFGEDAAEKLVPELEKADGA